jgi:hypothetical protein
MQLLEPPYQPEPPINRLKRAEVEEVMNSIKSLAKFLKNCLPME